MTDKCILVIDDERHMQRLIEMNLEKLGCRILTAGSGAAALEIIGREPIDLLLIDLVMPEKDGFATIRELRQRPEGQRLPVILLTGRGQTNTQELAAGLDIAAFLTKPFSPIKLIAEARKLLGE